MAAATENWLHECISQILLYSMDRIDLGLYPINWPECIALERRDRLRRFKQLDDKLTELLASYAGLDRAGRLSVRQAIEDQAALEDLFNGYRLAARKNDLPESVRQSSQSFFEKAFDVLKAVGIRDTNYKNFVQLVEHRICAFCGCEYFAGAGSKREPLDHYPAISLYPFAGANAFNLVPMGARCNSSYKLSQDVLRDRSGARRVCFNPYSSTPVRVSLMATRLFGREGGLPDWQIELEGDAERILTWDNVFKIKERYAIDHLDPVYKNTLRVFGALWRKKPQVLGANWDVCTAFSYLADLSRAKGWSDRAFLETALYELLSTRCAAGGAEGERIIAEYTDARWAG